MLLWWQQLQPRAIAFETFGWPIYWYGLIITAAILSAIWLARRLYLKNYDSDKQFVDVLFWLVLLGLVGARFFQVAIFHPDYYFAHPAEILLVWQGGLAIQGAITVGLISLWLFSRNLKFSFFQWADYLAPALALGQVIGRWGNFFNQELYGYPTDLPWAISISPELRLTGYESFATFHPVFLYESLLNLVLLTILLLLRKKAPFGRLTAIYLIGYGVIRFFIEMFKIDPQPVFGSLRLAQLIAIIFILAGLYLVIKKPTSK